MESRPFAARWNNRRYRQHDAFPILIPRRDRCRARRPSGFYRIKWRRPARERERRFSRNNSRDLFGRLICPGRRKTGRDALRWRFTYDSQFIIGERIPRAHRAQESNAFVEDELNSMNRADGSRILLVVQRWEGTKTRGSENADCI